MSKFQIWKEARGYSVWSHKQYSGDKLDCYGQFNSLREAKKELKRLRKSEEERSIK